MKSKFDSVILAGGFGRRLAPLTDSLPKPMLPIAGESAFERNVRFLRSNGFFSTAVTTMYLPEKIESVKAESGILEYFRESEPLGSAGAVANIKDRFDECVLVLSGDAVCDFDLKKAKEDFLKSGSDAAMILYRMNDSGEYGSVCVHGGRITGFCEKPSVRDTLSDLINTGIYIIRKSAMDLIPENTFFDFARDLFPLMLRKGYAIAGIEPKGHWFDIGSFGAYHQCNMWVSKAESCIGKHVSIHPSARIEYSVIFDNCTIGNSVLRGCVIGENVVIGNDCIIPPGCVIGPGSELRDGCSLSPGSIVGSNTTLVGNALIECFPKPKKQFILDDDAIIAQDDDGYFVRLGRILGNYGSIIAFAEGNGATLSQTCELACGVCESGNGCTIISGGNAAMASFSASEYGLCTAFVEKNGDHTEIRLFSRMGMPFSREELIKLSAMPPKTSDVSGSVYLLPHGALVKRYISRIKSNLFLPDKIGVAEGKESMALRETAEELGITIDNSGAVFKLSDSGERASALLPDGREISFWQLITIYCIEGKRSGILLPNETPAAVERILKRHSIDVAFYSDSESEERTLAESERLPRDGTMLAIAVAGIAKISGKTLAELFDRMPPFWIMTKTVFADRDKMSSVISRIREKNDGGRSAAFEFGEGRVSVYASASGRFRLIAEAVDFETAEEISLRAEDLLEKQKDK